MLNKNHKTAFGISVFLVGLFSVSVIASYAQTPATNSAASGNQQLQTTTVKPVEAKPFPTILQKGQTSEYVKDLQNILKKDPAVYPEGIVSGYYGQLTESAVKRLQKKYGLPITGIVDDATQSIIFPTKVELQIISPNGGEVWDRSETHTILWKASSGPVVTPLNQNAIPPAESAPGKAMPSIQPFFPHASLDLIRDSDSSFTRHIATVNMYQSQYNWKIPRGIPEGKDYRVRISIGGDVPCLFRHDVEPSPSSAHGEETKIYPRPCPVFYPHYSATDISDSPFAITGTVPPPPDVIAKLKEQARLMEETLNKLMNQLKVMMSLLESL